MPKTVKFGAFIGRFQGFHGNPEDQTGHFHVVQESLQKVDHLIMIIGSAFRARNTRNPWTYDERVQMITDCFPWEVQSGRIIFAGIPDYPSDDKWEAEVRRIVEEITSQTKFIGLDRQVFLCGQAKDHSSFYVRKFPEWEPIGIEVANHMINASDFRTAYFRRLPVIVESHLPKGTIAFLRKFQNTPEFKWLLDYYEAKRTRDKAWEAAPFPPKDVCADALCVQSGHVLLVTRDKFPGKGLLALPGGHVNEYERIRDAAVRELREETKIADHNGKIPAGRLGSYIVDDKRFDDPYRSDFGRVISHTFLFRLPDSKTLWKVVGSDDASDAKWYPLADLDPTRFHDDHYHIIQDMLGL